MSKFPNGPWTDEPDEKRFDASGLPCVVLRVEWSGHLCGYVGIPPSHPWHGRGYGDQVKVPEEWLSRTVTPGKDIGYVTLFCAALGGDDEAREAGFYPLDVLLHVHGGLTFASEGKHLGPDHWWFGFDCAHCDDMSPRDAAQGRHADSVYRTIEYVEAECRRLAAQLAQAGEWRARQGERK